MDTDKEFMYFSVETLQLLYGSWIGVGAGGGCRILVKKPDSTAYSTLIG